MPTSKTMHKAEYVAWLHARQRCTDPANPAWAHYGGRGIRMHQPWLDSFDTFLLEIGARPSSKHSLDRIDNDGHYEPGNVRWATAASQIRNSRRARKITIAGITRSLVEWCEHRNLDYIAVVSRLRFGWDPENALSTPTPRAYTPRHS